MSSETRSALRTIRVDERDKKHAEKLEDWEENTQGKSPEDTIRKMFNKIELLKP